jgi:hypothetical protein
MHDTQSPSNSIRNGKCGIWMDFVCTDSMKISHSNYLWNLFDIVQSIKLQKPQNPEKINNETKFSDLIELSLLYYVLKIRLPHQPPSWKNGGLIAL